jgi:hypothetical protein
MLAAIGDVRRDGMDPFERVEDADRGAGAGIQGRLDLETAEVCHPRSQQDKVTGSTNSAKGD